MTREEIADPLVPCSDAHCILAPQPRGPGMYTQGGCMHIKERGPGMTKLLKALGSEIVRLRALPVVATCGECRRATMLGQQRDAHGMPGYACTHDLLLGTPVEDRMVTASALNRAIAPPSWCPLRGKR